MTEEPLFAIGDLIAYNTESNQIEEYPYKGVIIDVMAEERSYRVLWLDPVLDSKASRPVNAIYMAYPWRVGHKHWLLIEGAE